MIQVSTEVANALSQTSRQFDAKIYVNGSAVDCEIMSLKFHKGACGQFTVGSIFIPYVEMTLGGNVSLTSEFELKIAVKIGNSFSTYYRVGYFKPTSVEKGNSQTEVYAQGRIANTNQTLFATEPTARTLNNILTAIRNKGYTVDLKDLTIPSASIDQLMPLIGLSVRDGLGLLASCSGGYATEDSNGHFVLGRFKSYTPTALDGDKLANYPTIKGTYTLTGITVVVSESVKYNIGGTPNFEIKNPYFNADMVSTFTSNTIGYTFPVTEMPISLGDFRYEPMDYLSFGGSNIPCFTLDFEFDGGMKTTVKSEGELPEETNTKTAGPMSAQLQEAYDKAIGANNLAAQANANASQAVQQVATKEDTFSKSIYVGSAGNPRPVKFCTVDYNNTYSEAGVSIKIRAVSGHGNGSSYNFLEDIFLSVNYLGQVSVNCQKYYDQAIDYDGATRAYGDIFLVQNTTNKVVDLYILCGQYSTVKFTPYQRLNLSDRGVITQYTSLSLYSSGTKVWGNNVLYANSDEVAAAMARANEAYEKAEEGSDTIYTKVQYAAHSSSTRQPTSGWQDEIPALTSANPYLWTSIVTVKRDATTGAETIQSRTQITTATLLNGAYAFVSGAADGTTLINGGCLRTGTIDADQVTIKNLKVLGDTSNYCNISSSGLEVYKNNSKIASFGSSEVLLAGSNIKISASANDTVLSNVGFGNKLAKTSLYSKYKYPYEDSYAKISATAAGTIEFITYDEVGGGGVEKVATIRYGNLTLNGNVNATYLIAHSGIQKETVPASGFTYNASWYLVDGNYAIRQGSGSARKWKREIADLTDETLDPRKLYDLPVRQFYWDEEHKDFGEDLKIGLIADEVGEYYPVAVCYDVDENGEVFECNWNDRYITPAMLKLIQDQHKDIEELKAQLQELRGE